MREIYFRFRFQYGVKTYTGEIVWITIVQDFRRYQLICHFSNFLNVWSCNNFGLFLPLIHVDDSPLQTVVYILNLFNIKFYVLFIETLFLSCLWFTCLDQVFDVLSSNYLHVFCLMLILIKLCDVLFKILIILWLWLD